MKAKLKGYFEESVFKMSINDRFTRGWVAGTLGGFIGGLLGFLSYTFGISQMRFTDWSAVLVFGRPQPFSLADQIYGLIVTAGSTGVIGIVFAFLIPVINKENIYFKGWIIFLIPWWTLYLVTALAKIEGLINLSVMTALSDGIVTSITGLVGVYFYRLLEPK
ncbi:MAG: hypothetical protein K0R09_1180 [Clostridiales bacterium]|nr:hypothetical protein [Clostridiales bacterium]